MRRSMWVTVAVAVATGQAVSWASAAPQAGATSGTGTAQVMAAPQEVIVVLRDQLATTPVSARGLAPRRTKAVASQDAVLGRLAGSAPTAVKHFTLVNAFSATVSGTQAAALTQDPRVASVIPDRAVTVASPTDATADVPVDAVPRQPLAPVGKRTGRRASRTGRFALCPDDPSKPLVEPEALESIRARTSNGTPYAQQIATGRGVKVAFIADTMDPDARDFIRRNGSHVFVDYQDFSGAGPSAVFDGNEAFGDASSIAAQGTVVHDLSDFVNPSHPLPPGCNIRVLGVAPGASLVGLVFGSNSSILQAIDYAVATDHVDVLNESFGLNTYPDRSMNDTTALFNDAAVAAGVTVTKSSGDGGITNTIGSPGGSRAIQVGATTDNRLYEQTGFSAAQFSNGTWLNDNVSALSSSGITNFGHTIDLVAPGESGWAACAPAYDGCRNFHSPEQPTDLQPFGGTSESAPLTAGVAALVIDAYRSTHAGVTPTPAVVKRIITGTARDLGVPADEQGAGLLDARAATEAALSWPGGRSAPHRPPSHLVTSADQITLTGRPGSVRTGRVKVTNVGSEPMIVRATTRGYRTFASRQRRVRFDSTNLPTFVYANGITMAVKQIHFRVPAGGQRLLARMAFQGTGPSDMMRFSLLSPSGSLVANNRPQGATATANYANVDVRNPAPGRWTAVLFSVAGDSGYHAAPLRFRTDVQRTVSTGHLDARRFSLGAGRTRTVRATFRVPSRGGDAAYALSFATSTGQRTAVSTILRALIDTRTGGAYSGKITGGNARPFAPAQTFSYAFDVPPRRRDLDVSLRLTKDPNNFVDLVLIDPNREVADVGTNLTLDDETASSERPRRAAQLFDAHPLAGRWHLVVVVQNPVSGAQISQLFKGHVTFDRLRTRATSLPQSARTVLRGGRATTAEVVVRNTGTQAMLVGVDPRLDVERTLTPVPLQGNLSFSLPDQGDAPIFVVPPDTRSLTVAARSTVPAQVELENGSTVGVDVFGDLQAAQAGRRRSVASISETRGSITPGIWFTTVSEIGPFSDPGAPSGATHVSAAMRTAAFDPAVTSSTDDPFRVAVDPSSDGFGTPVYIKPGGLGRIQVTITPRGDSGSVVRGHLNLVTPSYFPTGPTALPQLTTGSIIQSIPYAYRIR